MKPKLISWQTYLKSNPQKYYVLDSVFGRMVIEPTLRANGFTISNYNEYNNWDKSIKPKDVAISALEGKKYDLAVYTSIIARDGHASWVMIGYKLTNQN